MIQKPIFILLLSYFFYICNNTYTESEKIKIDIKEETKRELELC